MSNVYPNQFRVVFLGSCLGIGLKERGPNDPHVLIQILVGADLVGDDENWFTLESSFSSFWLPDLEDQLTEAKAWIEQHCTYQPGGWIFK